MTEVYIICYIIVICLEISQHKTSQKLAHKSMHILTIPRHPLHNMPETMQMLEMLNLLF